MFTKSARFYDAIYARKDYAAEAEALRAIIASEMDRPARTLLDVACGTGRHLAQMQTAFEVEGADLNEDLLALAKERLPNVRLHHADMRSIDLGRDFDAVTCLFGAIGYLTSREDLEAAIAAMARHVAPGGLLIVDPWWPPDKWVLDGNPRALFVDEPELKIARMSISGREGDIATLNFHYLVATREGVFPFTENHRLGLFTMAEQVAAFRAAGLDVRHDAVGLIGRGIFVGRKPDAR
jgi:ubiquinone/menaquinone biosynthesis C-methylase UbiE